MLNIVIDSNIIFSDPLLSKPSFNLLGDFLKSSDSKLFVPEIVVQEVKNTKKKNIDKMHSELIESLNKLNGKTEIDLALNEDNDLNVKIVKEYYRKFDERLSELNVEIPKYEEINHSKVVEKSLKYKKPFKTSGSGYRDTLIWFTILTKIANNKVKTVFITKNSKDFGASNNSKYCLHDNLKDDLINNNLNIDSVILCRNLEDFIEEFIKKDFSTLNEIVEKFELDKKEIFTNYIDSNSFYVLKSLKANTQELINRCFTKDERKFIISPRILNFHSIRLLFITSYYQLENDNLFVAYKAELEIQIEFEVENFPRMMFFEDFSKSYTISNEFTTENIISYTRFIDLEVTFNFTFDNSIDKVQDFELKL